MTDPKQLAEERYPGNILSDKLERAAFIAGYNEGEKEVKRITKLLHEQYMRRISLAYPEDRDPDSFWEHYCIEQGLTPP